MQHPQQQFEHESEKDRYHEPKPKMDVRLQGTAVIWVTSFLMVVMTVPISAASGPSNVIISSIMIVAILLAATVGTVAIWNLNRSGDKETRNDMASKRIAELEERLANLETINNFERHLAEETLKRHEAKAAGKVMPDEQNEITASVSSSETPRVGI